jgi:hypothetical protein
VTWLLIPAIRPALFISKINKQWPLCTNRVCQRPQWAINDSRSEYPDSFFASKKRDGNTVWAQNQGFRNYYEKTLKHEWFYMFFRSIGSSNFLATLSSSGSSRLSSSNRFVLSDIIMTRVLLKFQCSEGLCQQHSTCRWVQNCWCPSLAGEMNPRSISVVNASDGSMMRRVLSNLNDAITVLTEMCSEGPSYSISNSNPYLWLKYMRKQFSLIIPTALSFGLRYSSNDSSRISEERYPPYLSRQTWYGSGTMQMLLIWSGRDFVSITADAWFDNMR